MEIKTVEIESNLRVDDVVNDHKKIFLVIHQSMLDESLDWNSGVIELTNMKQLVDPYQISQEFMNKTKLFNLIYDGINGIIENNFHNSVTYDKFYLIKLFNKNSLPIEIDNALIYFPQTNQAYFKSDHWWDERVLLSHEYVFVVPLIPNHSQM